MDGPFGIDLPVVLDVPNDIVSHVSIQSQRIAIAVKSDALLWRVVDPLMRNLYSTLGSCESYQKYCCNQRHSLQLFVLEFDTCLVWELLLLPPNALTAPSLRGTRWRHWRGLISAI